jgi:hypothetical protein
MADEVNEMLMGGGGKAFAFENLGDTVEGEILSATTRQQTSLDTGKPATWDDGSPKKMIVVVLQTSLRDNDEDDGARSVYLRGGNFVVASGKGSSSQVAVRDAVKRAGAKGLEVGGYLKMRYSGVGPGKRGFNPPKLYEAAYKAPVTSIALDDMA